MGNYTFLTFYNGYTLFSGCITDFFKDESDLLAIIQTAN